MPAKTRLNRQRVLEAAAAIIDAEGFSALTLNRLAQDLHIQPPSLYNHVHSMSDLLEALALRSLDEMGDCLMESAIGKTGPQAVRSLASAYRLYIKNHPGMYLLTVRPNPFGEADTPQRKELQRLAQRLVNVALAVIASFGLSGDDALHAVRGLRSLVHGFASLEIAGGFGMPLDLDESFQRLVEVFIQGLAAYDNK